MLNYLMNMDDSGHVLSRRETDLATELTGTGSPRGPASPHQEITEISSGESTKLQNYSG